VAGPACQRPTTAHGCVSRPVRAHAHASTPRWLDHYHLPSTCAMLIVALSSPLPSRSSFEHSLPRARSPLVALVLAAHLPQPHLSVNKFRLNSDHLPDPSSASNDQWSAPPLPVSHPPLLRQAPRCGQLPPALLQPGRHLLEDRVVLLMLPGPEVSRPDHDTEPPSSFPSDRNPPPLTTLL
jgi:hypothetical protein